MLNFCVYYCFTFIKISTTESALIFASFTHLDKYEDYFGLYKHTFFVVQTDPYHARYMELSLKPANEQSIMRDFQVNWFDFYLKKKHYEQRHDNITENS